MYESEEGSPALVLVRHYAGKMQTALDEMRLPEAMKQASNLFAQLRTSSLSPRAYYELFTSIFDESRALESSLLSLGEKVGEWYEKSQYGYSVLPRLYLMTTVGGVCVKVGCRGPAETVFDLLEMSKAIQNPLRGLFLRYYLNKSLKDLFSRSLPTSDSIRFFLENLFEMHRLWCRLPSSLSDSQERNDLCVLLGENITRLSQLPGVSLSIYQDAVFPRLLATVTTARDALSQGYLIDGIIHTFPDEFHVYTLGMFLDTVEKYGKTDKLKLAEMLVQRLILYSETGDGKKAILTAGADVVLKTFIETTVLSTEVTETQALDLVEKLIILLDHTRDQDFHLENEVIITIGTKLTMDGQEPSGSAEKRLLSILSLILQRGNFQAMEMTSFRNLLTYMCDETQAEVSSRALNMMLTAYNSLTKDDIPTFLTFSASVISNFRVNSDTVQREAALMQISKLIHRFSIPTNDLSRLSSRMYPSLCVDRDAARVLSPALLFALSKNLRFDSGDSATIQMIENLLETVENCDSDIGFRLGLFLSVAHVELAEQLLPRSLHVWRSRLAASATSLDTVFVLLASLHLLAVGGVQVASELTTCFEVIQGITSHTERCRAVCAFVAIAPRQVREGEVMKNAIRLADLSGTFELIAVLNTYVTMGGDRRVVSRLIELIHTLRASRREQRYLLATINFLQACTSRGEMHGVVCNTSPL